MEWSRVCSFQCKEHRKSISGLPCTLATGTLERWHSEHEIADTAVLDSFAVFLLFVAVLKVFDCFYVFRIS